MKKLFNLENLIYFTILFLPAYLIRLGIFGIPMNVLEILILIIFYWWLFNAVKTGFKPVPTEYRKYIISIIMIFLGLVISSLVNKNYPASFGIIKSWFLFPMLFVFLISQTLDKNKIINVYKILYLSAFLVSLISLGCLFLGKITYDGRLQGFFNSPNYLAMYLAPALLILAQVQSSKPKAQNHSLKFKYFILMSGIIMLTAFYFTYSYAAWIAVALSLLIASIIKNKKLPKNKTIIILISLIILLFIAQLSNEKLINLKNYNRSSLQSRIMIWQSAGKILKDNWLLGIGPGDFQEKYLEYQKYYLPYLEWAVPHPHNLYLAFWLYGGLIGFIAFLWLLILWFNDVLKKENNTIKFIVLGIMLYFLIHGIVDTTYFKNDLAVIFWLSFLALK